MNAAGNGDVSKVAEMLEAGMPVDIEDEYTTALHKAAEYNRTDVVRCLLDNGASVNKKDSRGRTALHSARFMDSIDVMRMLLQRGATKDIHHSGDALIDDALWWNDSKEAADLLEQY